MKDLTLTLSLNETNLLIKALSQLPYNQVHELIAKIHSQATAQIEDEKKELAKEKG